MPMSVLRRSFGGLRVLVAGGGVAGLEAMLALRALARDLVEIELLSAEHDLWYRPYATAEPFEAGAVDRFEVAQLAAAAGATFTPGQLARVDPAAHTASTTRGLVLPYDMLVIACGALPRVAVPGALTFRGPADADLFRRLLDDLERENVRSIAFVQPPAAAWPLPLYELALETGAHLERRRPHEVELALISHEPAPLAALGPAASDAVAALLRERRIAFCTDCDPAGLLADRVVALPQLEGQPIEGIPDDADGFVATGESGRVVGLEDVFAAGDITSFPVKQGGVAAQQADAVAEAIAARAGANVVPQPFRPTLRAVLLTGKAPLYLEAELSAGGATSRVSSTPLWAPAPKIDARYLAPVLARARRSGLTGSLRRRSAAAAASARAPSPPRRRGG